MLDQRIDYLVENHLMILVQRNAGELAPQMKIGYVQCPHLHLVYFLYVFLIYVRTLRVKLHKTHGPI